MRKDNKELYKLLEKHFDIDDIRKLVFLMDIQLDKKIDSHSELIIELIQFCKKHRKTKELIKEIQEARPNLQLDIGIFAFENIEEVTGFFARVKQLVQQREPNSDIEYISKSFPHLCVTNSEFDTTAFYGIIDGSVSIEYIDNFIKYIVEPNSEFYRQCDYLIYKGEKASHELEGVAWKRRVKLQSLPELQNLLDFSGYVKKQTIDLSQDNRYPPSLYVTQQLTTFPQKELFKDALAQVQAWLDEPRRMFILILGEFGTGKTFLMHELVRLMGKENIGNKQVATPILLQMRELHKTLKGNYQVERLVSHQILQEKIDFNPEKFRSMVHNGRVIVFFDGYDELDMRVTAERATEYFEVLLETIKGGEFAKIVVTARTQHFISDNEIAQFLLQKAETVGHTRCAILQPFNEEQIKDFLYKRFNENQTLADERFNHIQKIKDLMGLSHNPRMLGFIADLDTSDLDNARDEKGEITSAILYEVLLNKWLKGEQHRADTGEKEQITLADRQRAVAWLAIHLWQTGQHKIHYDDLRDKVEAECLHFIERLKDYRIAAHHLGSGTLLVRDEQGYYSFIHQSIMEWLIAQSVAMGQKAWHSCEHAVLGSREMTFLMADFFITLSGKSQAVQWARETLQQHTESQDKTLYKNALKILLQAKETDLQGYQFQNWTTELQRMDFSGCNLSNTDFTNSDLTACQFRGAILHNANFTRAMLKNANFTKADLSNANFTDAICDEVSLLGATVHQVNFSARSWRRAKLLLINLPELPPLNSSFGVALPASNPDELNPEPMFAIGDTYQSVCFSPDDSLIAVAVNNVIQIWAADSGQCLRILEGHKEAVNSVAWRGDGTQVLSGSDDNSVRVWDVGSGQCLRILAGHESVVTSVAWRGDGAQVLSGSDDKSVRVWDVGSGQCLRILEGHESVVTSVAWRGDGAQVLSGSWDKSVRVWDVGSGQCLRILAGHTDRVWSVAWRGDGAQVLSGSWDKSVRVWDVGSGQCLRILAGHENVVTSVAWRGDGAQVLSGSWDKSVRVWDVGSGQCLRILEGHKEAVNSVAWRGDGAQVLSGSSDKSVRAWDVGSGQCLRILAGHEGYVDSVAWRGDGAQVLSGSWDNSVRVWDVGRGQCLRILAGHTDSVWSVAWRGDGAQVLSGSWDKSVRVWDVGSGQCLRILAGHENWVTSVAWRGDGAQVLSGSEDKSVRVWDVGNGQCLRILAGHTDGVWSVAWRGDGAQVLSGSSDNSVRVWDVGSGQCLRILAGHTDGVWSVAWRGDGAQVLSGSSDKSVRVWDVGSGQCLRILAGHTDRVWSVAWRGDGAQVLSGSSDDSVRVWDVGSGQCLRILAGHESGVTSAAWRNDDKHIISSSHDGTIRLWDAETGECLAVFIGLPDGWVSYSPKTGRYNYDGNVQGLVWHVVGLCRFEIGELDEFMPELRLKAGETLF
ncbi:pentapeptide repeat-containing protein [Beggiatoa leptomitoformis]|uniref:NACHT domain-containing protein n=1 Tax=Beggiatoa leptomitoformis TaxID=288004 RepID=A0A2N9YEA6_9GAMM|nr:pentapeptide repeat-containing protein [Beggiatoa leptomitoformis]AUI68821.1 NACHT domain-containing protein [Beggiatoa leptomitoformis]QGX03791.1 NACHT domain-containing protein [Beggiatoa leptomitoformis]